VAEQLSDFRAALGPGIPVDSSTLTRALYSSDASLYRVVPQAVVAPRDRDELLAVLDAARRVGLPVTSRGAGTSCAGNAVGAGLIIDLSKHVNKITSIDDEARTATIEPGLVHATLQRAAVARGLRFGPDPSTHTRCTVGGMIGNNACGPRALGYGRTADNVVAAELVDGLGRRLSVGPDATLDDLAPLREVVAGGLGTIRTEFGRFGRQVSGYSLEHLLPERGFDVARFVAGTEGTLGVITQATVRLVRDLPHKTMVALGYATMAEAADAMPVILPFSPTACEGMDRRILDVVLRARGAAAVPPLPRGDGWVFVELADDDAGLLAQRAEQLLAASGCVEGEVVTDPLTAAALWRIREDGAGLAGVSLAEPAYAGWEDAAVPPDKLGAYLRDFDALLAAHHLHGLPYGHFGDGCVHCRIDFPLTRDGGPAAYRRFVVEAADLVAGYGGSMSGEHGDGRARSELLPAMYSPAALALFGQVKQVFDPDNLMNPGVLVDPEPLDASLRAAQIRRSPLSVHDPAFVRDVHQCTGVGKCLADSTAALGVMCPSFQATRDEKDSTRGRAHALQEMVNGSLIEGGWRAPEVHEALELCLSCKGCRRDCPTGIDMAAYKARVLHESYRGRLRPRNHYALGWLPRWGRLVTRVPLLAGLANLATGTPGLRSLVRLAAGVDQRRSLPRFAGRTARATAALEAGSRSTQAALTGAAAPESRRPVLVWVDSFSDCFEGTGALAMVKVLTDAGFEPEFLSESACCGLTWISTGQLDGARRQLRHALDVLHPYVQRGVPIVGMEPSCLAVWRSDAPELVDDPRVAEVAASIQTLAEFLTGLDGWTPPSLTGHTIVAQPHCHHASVIGWTTDAALLAKTGADVVTVGGCCGLAGNFGVEQGHYEVSVAVAEHDLLPAIRAAGEDAIILADGFSCRTQVDDLLQRRAMTLAELLATHA